MDDSELNAHVELASKIMTLVIDGDVDNDIAMNGLAIATAAQLLDMSLDKDGSVNSMELHLYTEAFIKTLAHAVAFAKQQVDSGLLITES